MAREHSRGGRDAHEGRGRLDGKAVLISGAGSGMGRSAALLFAREGARLALCDNREPAVAATVDAIRCADGEAVGAVADVSRTAEVAAAVQLAVDSYGRLDVLYNNAGVWLPTDGPAPDLDEATWDRIIDVNLKGTFLGCKYAIPHLRAAGGGSIINVSARGGTCLGLTTDVTRRGRVRELVAAAREWGGGLDILVNNAGISGMAKFSSFMELSDELWDSVMAVNLKGAFLCSQEAARTMIEQRSGKIIHISSVMGLTGEEFAAVYCASKAGLIGLTRVMALELAPFGINVNCIAPGFIRTDTVQPIIDLMGSADSPYRYPRRTPLGAGQPRDIGDAVVFLASDQSSFLTGSTLVADGGYLAC